jgi:hypothetical protein
MDKALKKNIDIQQKFANAINGVYREQKLGITQCCFSNLVNVTIDKYLCDWKNSATNKTVIYSNIPGVFIEPLVSVNEEASLLCPETPTNVCTIIDLELLLKSEGTFIFTQSTPLIVWTITHNLGKFPSVTVVDNNNQVVVGDINYINTNVLSITFDEPFAGFAYLN